MMPYELEQFLNGPYQELHDLLARAYNMEGQQCSVTLDYRLVMGILEAIDRSKEEFGYVDSQDHIDIQMKVNDEVTRKTAVLETQVKALMQLLGTVSLSHIQKATLLEIKRKK